MIINRFSNIKKKIINRHPNNDHLQIFLFFCSFVCFVFDMKSYCLLKIILFFFSVCSRTSLLCSYVQLPHRIEAPRHFFSILSADYYLCSITNELVDLAIWNSWPAVKTMTIEQPFTSFDWTNKLNSCQWPSTGVECADQIAACWWQIMHEQKTVQLISRSWFMIQIVCICCIALLCLSFRLKKLLFCP